MLDQDDVFHEGILAHEENVWDQGTIDKESSVSSDDSTSSDNNDADDNIKTDSINMHHSNMSNRKAAREDTQKIDHNGRPVQCNQENW